MAADFEQTSEFPIDFEGQQIPTNLGRWVKWGLVLLALILLFVTLNFLKSVYTDWLWYGQLGLRGVYAKIIATRVYLFLIGGVVMACLLGASLYFANRYSQGPESMPLPPEVVKLLKRLVLWGTIGAGIIFSVIFGAIAAGQWETWLRFLHGVSFGVRDPVYDRDVSFYVFTMPMFNFVQGWLLGAAIVILLATLAIYYVNFSLRNVRFQITTSLKVHVSIIAAIIMFILGLGHWLDRWDLVLSGHGAVFGAAYTDLHARKTALLILTIVAVGAGVLMLVNAYMRRVRLLVGALALWVVMALVLAAVWPGLMQRFTVNPNEFVKEQPYIAHNIEFTRLGFALDRVEERFYPADVMLTADIVADNLQTVNNIRLWDHGPLTSVYKQIQLIRPYYDFKEADVDRYVVDGEYRQVLLAAREVAPEKLEVDAQTWVNERLIYTHGFGLAMSPVTEFTREGRPTFLAKDIPSEGIIPVGSRSAVDGPAGEVETIITNPRIYYGENTTDYVIVNTKTDEVDYQTQEGDLFRTNYFGSGGVKLSSFFRKLAYAWELGDINILISGELRGDSLIQYKRQVQERISTIAPFLLLDQDPYIVAVEGQIFWIQDAYTTTDRFPYSDPLEGGFNYIRNSVKVSVDAYNGTVRFYIADAEDPLIKTYNKIFPDLLVPMDDPKNGMPESMRAHTRYPQDFFLFQALTYVKYHMKEPLNFYNNEDLWSIPQEKFGQGEALQNVEPYYVIMKLPQEEREEFVLLMPYTPNQRKNLIGWLAARSDGENYGRLIAFNFPKDRQVDGPEQIEARIDNDQFISQWFTLRCQAGSFCIRGNLLVIPLGESLLYAEPIYLQAEGVEFPELKKVILASVDKVVMEDTVEEALESLTAVSPPRVTTPDAVGELVAEEPAVSEDTASEDGLESPLESLRGAIQGLKDNLSSIEESLERLEEQVQGEE